MIEPPGIEQSDLILVARLHVAVPKRDIRSVMGPGLAEVMAAIKAQGSSPSGPWFTHHLRMDPDVFDLEICVPVVTPIVETGRVMPAVFPPITVARTVYHGNYDGLGNAWAEFRTWLTANGHVSGPGLIECYLIGPETSANPADWRTEFRQPLVTPGNAGAPD